jgi:hypothetical protein
MAGAPSAEEHTPPGPSLGLTPAVIYGGAALWSLAMVSSLLVYEWRLNRFNSFHLPLLTVIFASGGATGWLTAVPIARWLTLGRGRETRLAAYILGLTLGTLGFTAFLFPLARSHGLHRLDVRIRRDRHRLRLPVPRARPATFSARRIPGAVRGEFLARQVHALRLPAPSAKRAACPR